MTRAIRYVFALIAPLALACTHDFDQFDPVGDASSSGDAGDGGATDAGRDQSAPQDAGTDSPACNADSCFTTASACGHQCGLDSATCVAACGNNNGCKQNCRSREATCRAGCETTCVTCTQNAGCVQNAACADAAATP